MMPLQQEFDRKLGSLTLNGAGLPSFLVAVSGGVDSMTLATLFASSPLHPHFEVAHVNFSLRGKESDADEALVREWCSERGITLHVHRFDTKEYASQHKLSTEMAARELRYGWFREVMDRRGLGLLAVAHNLNDNVETLMLNLLRGTGLKGASGMGMLSDRVFRPLLGVSRAAIETFAKEQGIKWRTDSTNLESDFARNRIRNEVFPQFQCINPSFLESISKSMAHFGQALEILDGEFSQIKERIVTEEDGIPLIDIAGLNNLSHRNYWLFRLLEGNGFNAAQIDDIERALDCGESVGKLFRSDSHILVRDRKALKLYDNQVYIRPAEVSVTDRPKDFNPKNLPSGTLCVDAGKLTFPLTTRLWRDGDRFHPFGMQGSRLVSDFLTDLKLDREQKRRQSVVIDDSGKIICVSGLRIDDRFRIVEETKKIAFIR